MAFTSVCSQPTWRHIDLTRNEEPAFTQSPDDVYRNEWIHVIPRALIVQFRRLLNAWFLLVVIVQLTTSDRDKAGWEITAPLGLSLISGVVKDVLVDMKKIRSRKHCQTRSCEIWDGERLRKTTQEAAKVGNFVLLRDGDEAPADLILLATANDDRVCYVETANIGGKPLFQRKKAVKETTRIIQAGDLLSTCHNLSRLAGTVKLGEPTCDFETVKASVKLARSPTAEQVGEKQFLLSGSVLRGTAWAVGLVAYSESETMAGLTASKHSGTKNKTDETVNVVTVGLAIVAESAAVGFSLCSEFAGRTQEAQSTFLDTFIAFCALFATAVPIATFVALDVYRLWQVRSDGQNMREVLNPNMLEGFGQVEYAFVESSVLTDRPMRARSFLIGESEFFFEYSDMPQQSFPESDCLCKVHPSKDETSMFTAPEATLGASSITSLKFTSAWDKSITTFCECLCLCTSIIIDKTGSVMTRSGEDYCLLTAINEADCAIETKTADMCTLRVFDQIVNFSIVAQWKTKAILRTTQAIVQKEGKAEGRLYIKGPFSSLKRSLDIPEHESLALSLKISQLQQDGVMTLALACADIPADRLESLRCDFSVASTKSLTERIHESVEKEFPAKLIGLITINMNSSPAARDSIQSLSMAGVRVWMLSDSHENDALATAYSVGVIQPDMSMIKLKNRDLEGMLLKEMLHLVTRFIEKGEKKVENARGSVEIGKTRCGNRQLRNLTRVEEVKSISGLKDIKYVARNVRYNLVIDGETLKLAFHNADCRQLLAYLLFCASSVCFLSLSNGQKRELVRFVKENFSFHPVTMAVVSDLGGLPLLQTADIGVALSCKLDILRYSCDLTIANIGLLGDFLISQGHVHNTKISDIVLTLLFNSVLSTGVLLWYSLLCDYSGMSVIDPALVVCSSALFTTVPVVYFAVIGRHVRRRSDIVRLSNDYSKAIISPQLSSWKLLGVAFCATVQSLVISVLIYLAVEPIHEDGRTESFSTIEAMSAIAVVTVSNANTALTADHITVRFAIVDLLCTALLFVYLGVSSAFSSHDTFGSLETVFSFPAGILTVFISPFACVSLSLLMTLIRNWSKLHFVAWDDAMKDTCEVAPCKAHYRLLQFQHSVNNVYTRTLKPESDKQDLSILPVTLRFSVRIFEEEYQREYIKRHLPLFRGLLAILVVLVVLWIIVDLLLLNPSLSYIQYRVVLGTLFFLILSLTFTKWFRSHFLPFVIAIILLGLSSKITAEVMYSIVGGMAAAMIPMTTCIFLYVHVLWITVLNLCNLVLFAVSGVIVDKEKAPLETTINLICYEVVLAGLTIIAEKVGYAMEKADRIEYQVKRNTEKAVIKTREILSLLLPPFIIPKVMSRAEGEFIAENQGIVTIIFCDICDFDTICTVYEPSELIDFLDEVFQHFDQLCQSHSIAKIETVGKTYLACSGLKCAELPTKPQYQAYQAIKFAFNLLSAAQLFKLKDGNPLRLKIGINSGPVVAGVVGYHKPQFSLVGDTVNIASRMCSTLDEYNCVQLSGRTAGMVEDISGIVLQLRRVFVKGKGEMETYLVSKKEVRAGGDDDCFPSSLVTSLESDCSSAMEFASRYIKVKRAKSLLRLCCPLMSWKESAEETTLRMSVSSQSKQIAKWNSVSTIVIQLILFLLRVTQWVLLPNLASWEVLVAYGLLAMFPLGFLLIPKKILQSRVYSRVQIPVFIVMNWLVLVDFLYATEYLRELIVIEVMSVFLLSTWAGLHLFKPSTILAVAVGISWLSMSFYSTDLGNHMIQFLFIVVYASINNYAIYSRERHMRDFKHLKKIEDREILKNERLLEQMMPKSVYDKLKQDLPVTDKLLNITILFADIVGFTNWSSDKSPEQVVGMLSALFTQFDLLCVRLKIYKVHTIGDCYVVMGFDGASEAFDPDIGCLRVLCMGHEMIRIIREVNLKEGISLNMRIGIHTGDVIAGITGKDVIRYDIYGPDVMIANKAESGGSPGKVNITEVTREILERVVPDLEYSPNKEIELQSREKVYKTFLVCETEEEKFRSLIIGKLVD